MLSFYGHDDGVGFTTYRSRTQIPRSSSRALEPTPTALSPRGIRNTARVESTFSSPESSSSNISSLIVSLPGVEPSSLENGPCTPENQLLTPPSSSRTFRTRVAPRLISHHAPTTLEETCDLIVSFLNSGQTRPCSIRLTDTLWSEFLDARDSATHDSNPFLRHLRFMYDASTSTLITRCMPSPVHDAAQLFFDNRLKRLIIERRLSYVESTRFAIQSGTDVGQFKGKRAGSRKQPDVAVMAEDLNDYFPLVAVEVGFSEGYEALMRDMELWLVGSEGKVRVVVLICLLETPSFQSNRFMTDDGDDDGLDEEIENTHDDDNPDDDKDFNEVTDETHGNADENQVSSSTSSQDTPAACNADDDKAVNGEIDDTHDSANENKNSSSTSPSQDTPAVVNPPAPARPYGPYLHNGHILVGQITGFLELWRLDPTTSLPVRTLHRNIFPDGAPPYADDNFELTILDLFGWPERLPQGCTPDEAVVFELAEYRQVVAKAVPRFGGLRLEKMENEKRKKRAKEGEPADGDWRAGKRRKV